MLHSSMAMSKSSPCGACGRPQVIVSCLVGSDHSAAGAAFNRHVADRQPAFHRKLSDALAGVFNGVANRAVDANPADDAEDDVLSGHSRRERAVDPDLHRLRFFLDEGLGGHDVLDLGSADTHREGAKRAVGGGVAVAANDDLTGLRVALLGPDDVDDALVDAKHIEQLDTEVFAVLAHVVQLLLGDRVFDRQIVVGRRYGVIDGRDRQIGRRTLRLLSRSPSNACGEVTS